MDATSYPERLKIDKLSKKGLTHRQIAEQSCLSIFTVRKWRRKLVAEGKTGLLSQMGRPKRGAMSSYPTEMRHQLFTIQAACSSLHIAALLRRSPIPDR